MTDAPTKLSWPVRAEFQNLSTLLVESRVVQLEYDSRYHVLRMLGGPTGYESFKVTKSAVEESRLNGWLACFGTPGRWDECYVPADEMERAWEAFGQVIG